MVSFSSVFDHFCTLNFRIFKIPKKNDIGMYCKCRKNWQICLELRPHLSYKKRRLKWTFYKLMSNFRINYQTFQILCYKIQFVLDDSYIFSGCISRNISNVFDTVKNGKVLLNTKIELLSRTLLIICKQDFDIFRFSSF